jgi:hypothetical protein
MENLKLFADIYLALLMFSIIFVVMVEVMHKWGIKKLTPFTAIMAYMIIITLILLGITMYFCLYPPAIMK